MVSCTEAAPANEDCATAQPITVNAAGLCPGSAIIGNTIAAVPEAIPFSCYAGPELMQDVWYTFSSGTNTSINYVFPSPPPTILVEVFEASCVGTSVHCQVGPGAVNNSFAVTPGTTYYMRVASVEGVGNSGPFTLCLSAAPPPPPPPANDDCVNAETIVVGPEGSCPGGAVSGSTVSAAVVATPFSCYAGPETFQDVWYTFNAGANSLVNYSFPTFPPTILVEIYEGSCVGTSVFCEIGFNALSNSFAVTPGEDYWIRVGSGSGAGNNGPFSLCLSTPPAGPPNDLCANAIPVTCGVPIPGTTVSATSGEAPTGCPQTAVDTAPGVWYTLTGACGSITAAICDADYDSKIAVASGTCGAFTCVVSNDDGCGIASTVTFTADPSVTYYIYVTGFGTATGNFTLEVTGCSAPPVADAAIDEDCLNNQFTVDVTVTDLGGGPAVDVDYSVNGGATQTQTGLLLGTTQLGGTFASTDQVQILGYTNGTCSAAGEYLSSSCPIIFDCNNPPIISGYCYGATNRTWTFTTTQGGETLSLTFLSGCIAPGDVISFYDGTDNSNFITSNNGATDLSTIGVVQSSGESIFVEVTQATSGITCQEDGVGSCPWEFTVGCTPGCTAPTGSATANATCPSVDVNILTTGDGGDISIRYTVNGGGPQLWPGTFAAGIVNIGPFTAGDIIAVTLLHGDQMGCSTSNTPLGSVTVLPAAVNVPLFASATPASVCPGTGTTQLFAQAGTTAAYTVASTAFGMRTGTPLATITGDDINVALITLPFTFSYFGSNYTQLSLSTNGIIRMGALTGFQGAPPPSRRPEAWRTSLLA